MNNEQRGIVERAAKEYEVRPEDLWKMYGWIMKSNFEQDIYDIARDNLDELKEMSRNKGV